jgi:putative hydrolase of the HAD superfamily
VRQPFRAVLWDFGGVILESPFHAFALFERQHALPDGFLRALNATNPDTNAWARLERGELTLAEFGTLFEAEAAAAGQVVRAVDVLALLSGSVRPAMVEAVRHCRAHLKTGLLTNNFTGFGESADDARRTDLTAVLELFDVIIESSKVGIRKPDPRFYEIACNALGIEPHEAVFLDDLGINLKPARAMGMTTIKVDDPGDALDKLGSVLGFPVR